MGISHIKKIEYWWTIPSMVLIRTLSLLRMDLFAYVNSLTSDVIEFFFLTHMFLLVEELLDVSVCLSFTQSVVSRFFIVALNSTLQLRTDKTYLCQCLVHFYILGVIVIVIYFRLTLYSSVCPSFSMFICLWFLCILSIYVFVSVFICQ